MSGSGGGGGYQYQAQATAYIATHILAKEPLHWIEHCVPDIPVAVAEETGGPGDDVRIELQNGTAIELQAKHGLKKDNKFWESIVKLIRGLAEDTSLYGVLLTDTTASSTIREELRKDIIRLGQGRRDDLKPISEELLTQLREQKIFYDLAKLFRRLRIIVVDSEDTQREAKTAITLLTHILANSEQAAQTWKILCDDGLDLITRRGRRDTASLLQLLGSHDIQLSLVANLKTTDWLQVCRAMLDLQKQLSTNEIIASETMNFDLRHDEIFVSLALVERKEPDRLDQQVHPAKTVERYEEQPPIQYEAFREQVLRTGMSDRIAIVGEPGAGKTTLLQHIAFWILEQQLGLPIWISFGDLVKHADLRHLKNYLIQVWLENAVANVTQDIKSDFLEQLNSQKVWLLLDGVDEIVASSSVELHEISDQLGSWLGQSCIVLTCRINAWDADINALRNFQTYRTKDFDYPTQVEQFIENGFCKSNEESGQHLKTELAKPEQNRLQKLVRNPLRLMMLCTTWNEQKRLPTTKAELYQRFVNEFYKWNRAKWTKKALNFKFFPDTKPKQDKLNQALGHLACRALDEEASPFRLPHNLVFDELGDPDEDGSNFWLALNLGWLQIARNSENASEKVYTFLHPTFQEYFAALAIDDWDYFLPREHNNQPVKERNNLDEYKAYRVFDSIWQPTILIWIGRNASLDQKSFIEKLTNFHDYCGYFYYYKAYFLAALGIYEAKSFNSSEESEIIEKIVNWGFDYTNTQQEGLYDFETAIKKILCPDFSYCQVLEQPWQVHTPIEAIARNFISNLGCNIFVISELEKVIRNCNGKWYFDYWLSLAATMLLEIDPNNDIALSTITRILDEEGHSMRIDTIYQLGESRIKNDTLICSLRRILMNAESPSILYETAHSLNKILSKNEMTFEEQNAVSKYLNEELDLADIKVKVNVELEENILLVRNIKSLLLRKIDMEDLDLIEFYALYEKLLNCARVMRYPDFYRAWHSSSYADEEVSKNCLE